MKTVANIAPISDIDRWPEFSSKEFASSLQALTNMRFEDVVPGMQNNLRLAIARSMGRELKGLLEGGIRPNAKALYLGEPVKIIRFTLPDPDQRARWMAQVEFADGGHVRTVNAIQLTLRQSKRLSPLDVECPACHSPAGKHCYRPSGHRLFGGGQHASRIKKARAAS